MKKTRIRLSLFSLVLALVLFGLTICATGREPFSVYWSILAGSFGSTKSFLNVLAYTLPLIMTGLGAAVAFQSGVFNIGGEGQVLVGGLAAVIVRSEEHTSELQSPNNLVCRLLLEKNFFNDTATTEIYTLSLHDALPICSRPSIV